MKKVLCGLVIALMMTDSGYTAEETVWDKQKKGGKEFYCNYLHEQAVIGVVNNEFFKEISKTYQIKDVSKYKKSSKELKDHMSNSYAKMREQFMSHIKEAHYYAVTYSALCD